MIAAARLRPIWRCVVAFLALVGAGLLIVVYTPLVNLLALPLWEVPPNPPKADVAIILSGGRYRDGSLNEPAIERTVAAVRLYHQGLVPRLLFTGGPCRRPSPSALMAPLAMELRLPEGPLPLAEQSPRTP